MAIQRTLLISQSDFENRVVFSDEVAPKYIIPHIAAVQDGLVKHTICEDLYNDIIEDIDSGYISSANQTLLDDYIKPYHVQATYARYVANANFKSTASGFTKNIGDNFDYAEKDELKSLVRQAEEDAEMYKRDLINYLENNKTTYPLYNCCNNTGDGFKISKIGYQCDERRYYDRKTRKWIDY